MTSKTGRIQIISLAKKISYLGLSFCLFHITKLKYIIFPLFLNFYNSMISQIIIKFF